MWHVSAERVTGDCFSPVKLALAGWHGGKSRIPTVLFWRASGVAVERTVFALQKKAQCGQLRQTPDGESRPRRSEPLARAEVRKFGGKGHEPPDILKE